MVNSKWNNEDVESWIRIYEILGKPASFKLTYQILKLYYIQIGKQYPSINSLYYLIKENKGLKYKEWLKSHSSNYQQHPNLNEKFF